jgi:general stress protein 26
MSQSSPEESKAKVLNVLGRQQLAVIATSGRPSPERCYPGVTGDVPESALVAFTHDDELRLYFQTGRHTRKAANLARNPFVALVISHTVGSEPYPNITVQYQGKARQLKSRKDLEACKQRFVAKQSPTTEKFFNDPSAIFFVIEPIWIGCSDYSADPPQVIEIDFKR